MSVEPFINVAELLAPIPGSSPSGVRMPRDLDDELKELRTSPDPEQEPNWAKLKERCRDVLTNTSKSVLPAIRLTEALTKSHGFAGARDGFLLLTGLFNDCFDRLNPPIDGDESKDDYAFQLQSMLDDPDRGLRFPSTLRLL
ncbi:MAG: type VI secretion system ImpA family N-terminal domain-containing protein, partial [Planctomycetia bacterium]